MNYSFNELKLHQKLTKLTFWKQQLFLLTLCQRLLPGYNAFLMQANLNDRSILLRLLEKAWNTLEAGINQKDFSEDARLAEQVAPDTAEYDSILVSTALDATIATSLLMRSFTKANTTLIVEGATLVRDSIDMYVQELENINPQSPELESMIENHPLMQLELKTQNKEIDFIENLDEDLLIGIKAAKSRLYGYNQSCLGLQKSNCSEEMKVR